MAHVHVVIVGFGLTDATNKRIYDYDADANNPTVVMAKNISPYLVEGPNVVIVNRSKPICAVPAMLCGNQPIDDGNYLFTPEDRDEFLKEEPRAKKYFRRWLGSDEFINGWERWFLWLGDCGPDELRAMPRCMKRVEAVQEFRRASKRKATQKLAKTPTRLQVETMPANRFIVVPSVSSERRLYIPIGFMAPETMISNLCNVVAVDSLFLFGVLTSAMHMAWVRHVCGRLESRYRYSVKLVYNNYPWPESTTSYQRTVIESKAQKVLDVRATFPASSLASLYDPVATPATLTKAHAELDRAVDVCYRVKPFGSDRERVEFLFGLYEKLLAPLTAKAKKTRKKSEAG